ncbi:MAG: elongation factor 1-beta [Candidatus Anstonellales archaeon]
MGEVAVTVKIFPEDVEKLEEIRVAVGKIVKIAKSNSEDIGFGLKALKIIFVMDDVGGVDAVEQKLSSIPGVSQVQVEDVRRI